MLPIASRPNIWTEWAETFCGLFRVGGGKGGGCFRLKYIQIFFQTFLANFFFFIIKKIKLFFHGQRRILQLENYNSIFDYDYDQIVKIL